MESPSVKLDLVSPATGTVSEINTEIHENLQKVNLDAETQYFLVIALDKPEELETLMNKKQYEEFTKES